jgi:hypothetical protein
MTLHGLSEIPRSAGLHASFAQTDLQGLTLEQYKHEAASNVMLGWSLDPWMNMSHDSMRDSSAVLIVLKPLP